MNEIKYFSMFTGVGGFELGIEKGSRSTTRCVGFSEFDPKAKKRQYNQELLAKRFPDIINYGDCTKINPTQLPDFDLLCGGFPCQAFSIAGKRRGFEDTRGTMFFEIARIAKAKRPKYLLLENVKGLLNHDQGKTFQVILQTLEELGYELQWMVLNSKFFGVPQNRERVFIIGSLRGQCRPEILPFRESSQWNTESLSDDTISRTISARFRKGVGNTESRMIDVLIDAGQAQRIRSINGLAQTLSGMGGGQGAKTGLYNIHSKIRRLTPLECERLQGFPDGWTSGFSDTQRYKMMGNAVTTKVIKAIAQRMFK